MDKDGNGRHGPAGIGEVTGFWRQAGPARWFEKDPQFDRDFKDRFLDLHIAAAGRKLDHWSRTAEGSLALMVLLDQFPRNAFRGTAHMYATDPLARMFAERQTEILIQVARAEPTTGTVLDAGVQRWNENGSADVLVATKISQKAPDGESTIESGSRWIATATKEGDQWKISQLIQVI